MEDTFKHLLIGRIQNGIARTGFVELFRLQRQNPYIPNTICLELLFKKKDFEVFMER